MARLTGVSYAKLALTTVTSTVAQHGLTGGTPLLLRLVYVTESSNNKLVLVGIAQTI